MDAEPLPPRLVDVLSAALRVMSRSLTEVLEREEGVSLEQWRALRGLASGEGSTMGELVDRLQLPAATVTRLIDGLVDRALVYRHASSVDRRRITVRLSETGRALLHRLEALAAGHEDQLRASGLSLEDLIDALGSVASPDEVTPLRP